MLDWFARNFGSAAEEFGKAITDIRSKLVDEGFWGRKVPEPQGRNGLGGSAADDQANLLDKLFHSNTELFADEPEKRGPEQDRGIDR